MREYAKTVPAGEWIYGFGFDNEFFTDTKEMPTKFDLDEACADHPVLLSRSCMHFFSANSLALKMAGIDRNFKPEVEGNVVFGADGEPTGVVCDAAGAKIAGLIPDKLATLEAKKDVLEQAIRELNTHGLTGVHPIQGRHVELMEYMDAYQELNDEGRLTARIYLGYDELPNCCIRTGLGDEMVKYGFYKLFVDGNLGGRTAALLEPYSDDPDTVGHCNYTQDEFTALVRAAYQRNIQVGTHVIGDRAADMLTTAIETVYNEDPKPDPRFRMIHMTVLNEDIIQRISKLPVIIDTQPLFIHTDMPWMYDRVGERSKYVNPWGRLLKEGMILTGGSDAPGTGHDPWEGIYAIVNRKDLGGTLIQHLPARGYRGHRFAGGAKGAPQHSVRIEKDSFLYRATGAAELQVNSMHHQAVDTLAPMFHATAFAPDGVIEAYEADGDRLIAGIQWHPEMMDESVQQSICRAFVGRCGRK